MQCEKRVMTTGLNFPRLYQCKRAALEGKTHCWQHDPERVAKPKKDGTARRKLLLAQYVVGLQRKAQKRKDKDSNG